MAVELRCDKRLHAVLTDEGILEVSCRSALCGHRDGVVVIHRFDVNPETKDGDRFMDTKRYREPPKINNLKE